MEKKIRNATRVFVTDRDKILVIKYINEKNKGYWDLPGGKIEGNESSIEAGIREVKEETGIDVDELVLFGKAEVHYPNTIIKFDLYHTTKYVGENITSEENESMWLEINKLLKKEKRLGIIKLLEIRKDFNFNEKTLIISCDESHNILEIKEVIK